MPRDITMDRATTMVRLITPLDITGARPATFTILILVGATGTGGIIIGGTIEIGKDDSLKRDPVIVSRVLCFRATILAQID
jgi:hypothetical protein